MYLIIQALSDATVFPSASSTIIETLSIYHDNNDSTVLQAITPYILSLEPLLNNAISSEDNDMVDQIAKIFTELAEGLRDVIIENLVNETKKLVGVYYIILR